VKSVTVCREASLSAVLRGGATGIVGVASAEMGGTVGCVLLCAIYNRRPWIAIKRTALFAGDNYSMIFSRDITADHVALVHAIASSVQEEKQRFPEPYLRSWQLTRLIATYLAGEILRADQAGENLLLNPELVRLQEEQVTKLIRKAVRFAAAAMSRRHDSHK